jgi:hypothetical protein
MTYKAAAGQRSFPRGARRSARAESLAHGAEQWNSAGVAYRKLTHETYEVTQ